LIKEKLYGKEEEGDLLLSIIVVSIIVAKAHLLLMYAMFQVKRIVEKCSVFRQLVGWSQSLWWDVIGSVDWMIELNEFDRGFSEKTWLGRCQKGCGCESFVLPK